MMNKTKKCVLEVIEIQDKLIKLKNQRPCKFYEFKGIVNTIHSIKTEKEIEDMLSGDIKN